MRTRALLVLFTELLFGASLVEYAVSVRRGAPWLRGYYGRRHREGHRFSAKSSWTPDPRLLLGEWEEEAPVRETNAYFMSDNNTSITVQVGATAALRCQVYDVADHETVSWIRRRDHHLITVGATTYSNDERFQVTFSDKLQDWTLHVHYTQPRDAGVYECQLSAHPPMGVFTTLHVIEALAEIQGGGERYVHQGSSVVLTCALRRFTEPPTYVFWFHEERMVNYDANYRITVVSEVGKSELLISDVTKEDSGNYTCQPANARAASVQLHVITGETPAAMQRASAPEVQDRFSLALVSTIVALMAL